MSNDKMREEFEAWVKTQEWYFGPACESLCRCDEQPDDYLCAAVHGAWLAWQASREALVIELPPEPAIPEDPEEAIDDSHMDAYHAAKRMRAACVKSVKASGVKVNS